MRSCAGLRRTRILRSRVESSLWEETMRPKTIALAMGLLLANGVAAADKSYGPGASDSEIKLGQSIPYSGPASAFSVVGRVQDAYFKMLNAQGGINGRKVELISLDNGFSPPNAGEARPQLAEG